MASDSTTWRRVTAVSRSAACFPETSYAWRNQIPVLAERYRVIAPDLRGYGETDSPDEAFNHVDDLEAVLKALDIHAAVFVGCSMGGGLAVDFALRHPGQVIGLVLIGTSVTGAPWSATDVENQMEAAEEDAQHEDPFEILQY